MGKGLAAGTILGGVTGAALLAVVSLYAPIPDVGEIRASLSVGTDAPQTGDVQAASDAAMDILVSPDVEDKPAQELATEKSSRPIERPQPVEIAAVEPEAVKPLPEALEPEVSEQEILEVPVEAKTSLIEFKPVKTDGASEVGTTPSTDTKVARPTPPATIEIANVAEPAPSIPDLPAPPKAPVIAETKPELVLETPTLAEPAQAVASVQVAALSDVDTSTRRPTGLLVLSSTYTIPEVDVAPIEAVKAIPVPAARPAVKPTVVKPAVQKPAVRQPETQTASALNRGGALNTTNRLNNAAQKTAGKTITAGESALTPVKPIVGGEGEVGEKADDIRSRFKGAATNRFQSKRLPTVTAPSAGDGTAIVPAAASSTEQAEGALRQHAAKFDATPGEGLISVILLDVGDPGLARDELKRVGIPITLAVDPSAPNAKEIMNTYRSAGLEVVAWLEDLPKAARPADVEVAMESYFNVLDEAVAVLDPLDGRIQNTPRLLDPILGVLRETGHGLVTQKRRLSGASQAASRDGVPSVLISKVLDDERETADEIKRYLDRAALNAGVDGSAILVGRSYPATVKALIEWSLENKAEGVSLAPVSAIMLQDDS